jgi:hypothetical protein
VLDREFRRDDSFIGSAFAGTSSEVLALQAVKHDGFYRSAQTAQSSRMPRPG